MSIVSHFFFLFSIFMVFGNDVTAKCDIKVEIEMVEKLQCAGRCNLIKCSKNGGNKINGEFCGACDDLFVQLERIGIKNGFTKKNVDEFGCKCEQKATTECNFNINIELFNRECPATNAVEQKCFKFQCPSNSDFKKQNINGCGSCADFYKISDPDTFEFDKDCKCEDFTVTAADIEMTTKSVDKTSKILETTIKSENSFKTTNPGGNSPDYFPDASFANIVKLNILIVVATLLSVYLAALIC